MVDLRDELAKALRPLLRRMVVHPTNPTRGQEIQADDAEAEAYADALLPRVEARIAVAELMGEVRAHHAMQECLGTPEAMASEIAELRAMRDSWQEAAAGKEEAIAEAVAAERERLLCELSDYFLNRDGVTYVVEELCRRREEVRLARTASTGEAGA